MEHTTDNFDLLRSFSLTCRQLRPRSFNLIIAQYVFLDSRDKVSDFCDFLLKRTELKSLIHSIAISPADFRPYPLVNMLPHLSKLLFILPGYRRYDLSDRQPAIEMHRSTITCYHSFGERIHTLALNQLSFRNSSTFYKLLLAFPTLTQLSCNDVTIKSRKAETPATMFTRSKLSRQLRLETLQVRTLRR